MNFPRIKYERKDNPLVNSDHTVNCEAILKAIDKIPDHDIRYCEHCFDLTQSIVALIETNMSRPPARPYAEYKISYSEIRVTLDKKNYSEVKLKSNLLDHKGLERIMYELKSAVLEDEK
jgi:hypothetical protein